MTRLTVFSFILLGACAIPRPRTELCIVNAPAAHSKCYWMDTDYDQNGNLLPGAVAHLLPARTVSDLNKAMMIPFAPSGQGIANFKAYVNKLKEEYETRCQ